MIFTAFMVTKSFAWLASQRIGPNRFGTLGQSPRFNQMQLLFPVSLIFDFDSDPDSDFDFEEFSQESKSLN
jgi:hypothetical protein